MSFDAPLFLLLLAALPLLVWWYVRDERAAQPARRFAPTHLMPSVAPRRAGWRRHAPVAGYAVAIVALTVALARPQTTEAVPVEQATVAVVTDRSGSMLATDVEPNRLTAAKRAARRFLDEVPSDVRVGAIAFNQSARIIESPTRDHDAVRRALDRVRAAGTTATGEALATALAMIRGTQKEGTEPAPAAIVLLSDGKSVRGRDPVQVSAQAARAEIPIYTVALGTAGGRVEGKSVPPDPAALREIARRTGGESFTAGDAERLEQVFEKLGSQVATEERDREVSNLFAGGAFAAMLLAAVGSLRWFGRPL